jgi:hypothetical protein
MNFSFKKTLVKGLAILATTFALSANANVIKTDIVFVVDESGSMGSVQANLKHNIRLFASILAAGGVDAQFGIVGYGAGSLDNVRLVSNFVSAANFATEAAKLVASGSYEPAYEAIFYALNTATAYNNNTSAGLSYRNDAVTNIIMLTDEDANVPSGGKTWAETNTLLQTMQALFNIVTDSAGNSTQAGGTLNQLAANNGGNTFNINDFANGTQQEIEAFVTNFASVKLQETIDFCVANPNDPACQNVSVPEPKGLVALALGLLFVRRFAKK